VTGNNASGGSGQGGSGTAAGTGTNASTGLQEATIYDPNRKGTDGEQLNVAGRPGEGPSRVVGQGNLVDPVNAPLVPLAQAFPSYRQRASEALTRLDIPPSMRAVVRAYFDSLGQGSGGGDR
jgi:hypothetical protein